MVTTHFDVLDYPLALHMPQRLTDVTSWHPHIPLAFTLMQLLRPKRVVELGTHKGDSYCAFCQAVDTLDLDTVCYAIDTWAGDGQAGYYGTEVLAELQAYHDPRYGRFSSLIQGLFDDALDRFEDQTIDLLHIDGLHTYEAVKHDFETWLPKMTCRGVVLLHDVNEHQTDFGVWKLWREIEERYPHCGFRYGHGLGIAAVGEEGAKALQTFFSAVQCNPDVSRYFSLLGERIELYRERQTQDEESTLLAQSSSLATAHIASLEAALAERDTQIARMPSLEAALAERDTQVETIQATLTKRDAEMQYSIKVRRELEVWAKDLEAKVKDHRGHIAMLTERLTFLTEREAELHHLLASAHEQLLKRDTDAHALLVVLEEGIAEQARQTSILTAQIGDKAQQIGAMMAQVEALTAEKNAYVREKNAYVQETEEYVAEIEQSWHEKNAHIGMMEAHIAMMEAKVQPMRRGFFARIAYHVRRILAKS